VAIACMSTLNDEQHTGDKVEYIGKVETYNAQKNNEDGRLRPKCKTVKCKI